MTQLPDPTTVRTDPCPEGYRYEWVPEPMFGWLAFRVTDEGKQCRFTDGGVRCENTAAAKINRSKAGIFQHRDDAPWPAPEWWWHYCADHLYGRRISGQRVWVIHTVAPDSETETG